MSEITITDVMTTEEIWDALIAVARAAERFTYEYVKDESETAVVAAVEATGAINLDDLARSVVLVDRARFERVLAFARAFSELPESFLSDADAAEAMDGLDLKFCDIQPGDLDPLPSPVHADT